MLNRHYLAGPTDQADAAGNALGNMITQALQGGSSDPDSPEAQKAAQFYGNVLGVAGRKVLASDEGQAALNKTFLQVMLPLSLVAFVAGYYYGKKKGQ